MLLRRVVTAAVVVVVIGVASVQAMPLNLTQMPPDIYSSQIQISYDAGTDQFTASGYPIQYDRPPSFDVEPGLFYINATIDAEGVATAGVLEITGTVLAGAGESGPAPLGPPVDVLLTGDLTGFGWVPDPPDGVRVPTFEFVFVCTGGSLAPDYGGLGAPMGCILSSFTSFPEEAFGTNYQCGGAVSDTFTMIPEPASMALLAVGLGALAARRRRRRS